MDEEQFMEVVSRVMQDHSLLTININVKELWLVVSNLQLAHRHPGPSQTMKDLIRHIGDQMINAICVHHPDAREPLEMGWDAQYDV